VRTQSRREIEDWEGLYESSHAVTVVDGVPRAPSSPKPVPAVTRARLANRCPGANVRECTVRTRARQGSSGQRTNKTTQTDPAIIATGNLGAKHFSLLGGIAI